EQERLATCTRGTRATARRTQRPIFQGKKKWPLRRAAKFREETPRKGGGLAIKDRNTALQQYAEVVVFLQAIKYNYSRQNAAEMLEKSVAIALFLIRVPPPSAYVQCSIR
ncbi:MAG TPA: hypothetical protein VHZ32_07370, partial [Rhizomicrobium sp.]|nr:hypothetical protein [Rhizomicrobium sp.]